MSFDHASSIFVVWGGALGMVGLDRQRLVEVGTEDQSCAEPFLAVDRHSRVGGSSAQRRAPTALGQPGIYRCRMACDGNCAHCLDELAHDQSAGHGVFALWVSFWDHGSDPVADPRATRGDTVALPAKATISCASAGFADATGTAFPLQYFERDH